MIRRSPIPARDAAWSNTGITIKNEKANAKRSAKSIALAEEFVMASVKLEDKPISWQEIEQASKTDKAIQTTMRCIQEGPDSIPYNMDEETSRLIKTRKDLKIDGNVLTFRGRPVIPKQLRNRALRLLHAAHQGTSKMTSRAESSFFWPNISLDIKTKRASCGSCDSYSPSQHSLPPVEPIVPTYPFQHIAADHLQIAGYMYGIIVDRFSNWIKIYEGKGGAATFIKILRQLRTSMFQRPLLRTAGPSM